jgi:5-methylcytosine-specific restriction endonuclease McrA
MLAAHLTPENAGELITAAMHKTKAQIELLLAERFPQPDLVASIEPIAPTRPAETTPTCPKHVCETRMQLAPGQVESRERPRVKPLAPERFGIQFTISEKTRAKLEHAQALRSHSIPGRDIAELFDRALDLLIAQAERERFAATDKPRLGRRSRNPRHIPAHVRREVWQRDQGRCTFVSESGHRCESPGHPPRGG